MALGKILGGLRSKNVPSDDDKATNLGKSLEVETMPQELNEEEEFEEKDIAIEEDDNGEDYSEELEADETEPPEEAEGGLSSEYEGQLTIDVFQTDKDIVIKSTIAGVSPESIDVSIDNDMVTIKGERSNEHEVSEEDYYYQECYWGAFSRSVILPVDVVADKADAKLKNGILTVKLPKAHQSKTKKISVKAA
ncbi:Hsp20/alpha crystallin family protein [Patescibacteria group bacterium]|nr:Hsp20/alpha crystallin family protein [Patescibacteria group bacterium]